MKRIMALIVVLMLALAGMVGCGGNPCEDACDKMKECGVEGTQGIDCSGDCPSEYEGVAECLAGLSCDDFNNAAKLLECASK